MKIQPLCRKGSALVITLAFLFLITILVVGLMDTVRYENVSSNSNCDALQAEFFAQAAVERVVGTLQQQTGTKLGYNWISQPGQLMVADASSNGVPVQPVPLHSGTEASSFQGSGYSGPDYFLPPDLNVPTYRDPSSHLITEYADALGNPSRMPVAWIYVHKSGALETVAQPDTKSTSDPIIGRYAYWTDDESSKINYNLAWGRTSANTNSIGDPSMVDLTALRPLHNGTNGSGTIFQQDWADKLHRFISQAENGNGPHGFYNTPEDARQLPDDEVARALAAYKFELTHYNSDPDTTFFGEPRIVLTTQLKNVPLQSGTAALHYLDILTTSDSDPGDPANIDDAKVTTTLRMLMAYLSRTDWPMAHGSSFQQKYYSGAPDRLAQLALNIIDYVRSKESKLPLVTPLRGNLSTGSNPTWSRGSGWTSNSYIGISRAPCITELAVTKVNSKYVVKIEIHSPLQYHLPEIDLNSCFLNVSLNGVGEGHQIYASEVSQKILKPGDYATVSYGFNSNVSVTGGVVSVRVVLSETGSSERLEAVPLISGGSTGDIPVTIDGASMEVNDPRVNKYVADWKPCSSGSNTFGRKNERYLANDVTNNGPQQDTDGSGALCDVSLYMPSPKGSGDNAAGVVSSIGELGYIHTGVQSALQPGMPWRTLRLQPNNDATPSGLTNTVPDWALMDLFTVPITVPSAVKAIFQPNGNSYGGRVNINSHVQPFDLTRILPLAAVFQGCRTDSTDATKKVQPDKAQEIARAIFDRTTASNGKLYGFSNGYFSPGEIAEIAGIADSGEQSEELIRQVANLLTARGNVFTVYAIGESIKQTPSGELRVTGQRRLQSMVERYVYDSSTGEVRFRPVFYRNLTP